MNRAKHHCNFHTVHGMLAKKDGTIVERGFDTVAGSTDMFEKSYAKGGESKSVTVPHYTVQDVECQYGLTFDTGNFDCEGCAAFVFQDFPELKQQLKLLVLECHNDDETRLVKDLMSNGWESVEAKSRQRVLYNWNRRI